MYYFEHFDIGDSGRQRDGSGYENSHIGYAIDNNKLCIPVPDAMSCNQSFKLPYVFVADNAFGLKPCMMNPCPGQNLAVEEQIFNYRLSRARRVIENAFGVMVARLRIFRRPIVGTVEKVTLVTKACVCLHNFLLKANNKNKEKGRRNYCPPTFADQEGPNGVRPGDWRSQIAEKTGLQFFQ